MKKLVFMCQGIVQIFVGLGAVVCGALMILVPSGALLEMPPDMLKHTPFHDLLVPGVILFLVNGVGQLVAAVLSLRRHPLAGYVGAVFGMGLMIWIFVQVSLIGGGHILQYVYFLLGVLEIVLSFLIQNYLGAMKDSGAAAHTS
jgi:hypothetical protein